VGDYAKELKKLLVEAGCSVVRQGKGDHEIRSSPVTSKRFPVVSVLKSRHAANEILRQAGLEKAF